MTLSSILLKTLMILMIIFSCAPIISIAQIKGTVKTKAGEPLVGVSIQINHLDKFLTTDINGHFSIPATSKDTLYFRYISYKPVEIIHPPKRCNVTMETDPTIDCDSFVVTAGYTDSLNAPTQVKGTVTDKATKHPLCEAIIKVKHSSTHTKVNKWGQYTIPAYLDDTLVFQSAGYLPREIIVKWNLHHVVLEKLQSNSLRP